MPVNLTTNLLTLFISEYTLSTWYHSWKKKKGLEKYTTNIGDFSVIFKMPTRVWDQQLVLKYCWLINWIGSTYYRTYNLNLHVLNRPAKTCITRPLPDLKVYSAKAQHNMFLILETIQIESKYFILTEKENTFDTQKKIRKTLHWNKNSYLNLDTAFLNKSFSS